MPTALSPTSHALRVAVAAVVCLVVAEWLKLAHGNLAVWTTHMVMAPYAFSAFQKGVERVIGRGLGILAGLGLITVCPDTPFLRLALEAILLLGFFYVQFAGRLAYTFLNAGLYLALLVEMGHADPGTAVTQGWELFLAVLVGVAVADVVTWLWGAERNLHIEIGGPPLWPIRPDWLGHSGMLVVTAILTQWATRWLDLPVSKSVVSVMMLTITPDVQAALRKGELRLVGAVLATAWSLGAFLLLSRLPHFVLLAGVLFLGIFVAAYMTRVADSYSYVGVQMGLVLPLLLVVPPPEFSELTPAIQRLEGVLVALVTTLLVGGLWPPIPAPPAPVAPGTAAPAADRPHT